MLPSKKFGKTVVPQEANQQNFGNLIPRPGWQEALGMFIIDI